MDAIKFAPSEGLSYNPNEEKYWDKQALREEINRTFEICHSCRMCFKFCDAFPAIFNLFDNENLKIKEFSENQLSHIADLCFQCKICYFKCPYTKDDDHEFNLDFPRLILRYKSIQAKEKGIPLRDKVLGNPDLLGKIGCSTAAISNMANKSSLNRFFMEKTIGIHREKQLPSFAGETFYKWFQKNKKDYTLSEAEKQDKVVLFSTCFGNYNSPEIAKDAVFVLWKNGVEVAVPKLNCCGMPAMESGNLDMAVKEAESNYKSLSPFVEKCYKILVLNPTCSLTMKDDYPVLLEKKFAREDLEKFSQAVFDTNEYLFMLKREDKFNRSFKSTPGKIAYHIPCHLRAQNIGYRSRDMMKTISETSFILVDECCGHNGTWAMKKENYKNSMRIGSKAFDKIKDNEHDIVATDCPLAAIQLEQGTGEEVIHTIQVLARAYREDGFEKQIVPSEDES
jgi:Fe-S oxidoreductase